MSAKIYVIADLHLGHTKLAEVRGFPSVEAHDAAITDAWRRVVTKKDVVYVLGDIFDLQLVYRLPGIKKLILGNHDRLPMERYTHVFTKVCAYYKFDDCVLSHVPLHPQSVNPRFHLNVHGHTHARKIDDLRYICVSLEHCPNFEPMALRPLIEERRMELRLRSGGEINPEKF